MRIYFRILGAHLRSTLEYEADFAIMIVAGLLFQVLNLVFLSAIFAAVPQLNGWTFAECVLISGSYGLIAGLSPLFCEGVWGMSWRINKGELDYPLVRPASLPAQLIGSRVGLHGIGDLIVGGAMVGWALTRVDVNWSIGTVLIGLTLYLSAAAIHLSLVTIFNLAAFWIPGPHPFLAITMHNIEDMVRYPMSIYGQGLRAAFTIVVPFAFVTYFPATWLLSKPNAWAGLLTPLVALYCIWLARTTFRHGLRRYESAGH